MTKRERRLLKATEEIAGGIHPARGLTSFYPKDVLKLFVALCEYHPKKWREMQEIAQQEVDRDRIAGLRRGTSGAALN